MRLPKVWGANIRVRVRVRVRVKSTSADVAAERQVADHVRLAESRGDDDVKVAPSPRGCTWGAHSVFACSRGRVLVEVT